jgi:hypothetical protein
MKRWGKSGAFSGGLWGMLLGVGILRDSRYWAGVGPMVKMFMRPECSIKQSAKSLPAFDTFPSTTFLRLVKQQ